MYELLSQTPQGAGTPDPQKSIFPQEHRAACPGMSSAGPPCSYHNLPEGGLMSLRHQTPHWIQQKFVEPKMLEINLTNVFPSATFPWRLSQQGVRRDRQLWGVRVSVRRDGTAPLPCCAQHWHVPWVTYSQIHWFYLPLLLYFLPIPPSRSSCLLVLLQCIFIHCSSPTGLSVLTKAFN